MPRTPVVPFVPPLPGEFASEPVVDDDARRHAANMHGPPPAWATPGVVPGAMPPGSYFPAPSGLPPVHGVSPDWVGWGGGGGGLPPPSTWSAHPSLHPGTPWFGQPIPMGAQTGFSTFQQPLPQTNYGVPPPAAGFGAAPFMGGGGFGAGMPMGMQGGYPNTPWHGGGTFPITPGTAPVPLDGYDHSSGLSRPKADEGGLNTRFWPGKHYGPVLDPLHVAAVAAIPKLNPLLTSAPDDPKDRDYIKWNMLYTSSFAQRSSDASHLSWSRGRDEPATFPRVSSLRLLSPSFPWIVDIRATHRDVGVTCGDVIDQLSEFMHAHTNEAEYSSASIHTQQKVGEAYHLNRSRAYGVPGGRMGVGLLRVDWLGAESMFDGIERDADYIRTRLGINSRKELPCVWVLKCTKRWMMSEEEQRDFEERERTEDRRRRSGDYS